MVGFYPTLNAFNSNANTRTTPKATAPGKGSAGSVARRVYATDYAELEGCKGTAVNDVADNYSGTNPHQRSARLDQSTE